MEIFNLACDVMVALFYTDLYVGLQSYKSHYYSFIADLFNILLRHPVQVALIYISDTNEMSYNPIMTRIW